MWEIWQLIVIQDYWVFGLCPSSGILKTQKNTTFRRLDLFPSSGEGTGDTYSVGPIRKIWSQSLYNTKQCKKSV
jgi:hypothetical protein